MTRVGETIELDRMAFLLATDVGDFERAACRPAWRAALPTPGAATPASAARLRVRTTVRLDDPLAATRFTAEEVEFWRDTGIYYFVPCVSKDAAMAVLRSAAARAVSR